MIKNAMRQAPPGLEKPERISQAYPPAARVLPAWLCHHGGDGKMWYDRFGLNVCLSKCS